MGSFALFTLAAIGVGIYSLSKAFPNFQPADKKILEDLKSIKAEMQTWMDELVPLTKEELELFSFDQTKQHAKKGLTKNQRGIFTSIYHEPLVAYHYREYLGNNRNALLYARTANREYIYRFKKSSVQVVSNQRELGVLQGDQFYEPRQKQVLATLNRKQEEWMPLVVKQREVAAIAKRKAADKSKLGQRAFDFIRDDMSDSEREIFLSLAILEVIEQGLS
ncbi:MAG TPA: hypothetical protein PKA00_20870 [Saprospiraceae bacterium]|nr:hypothetical protein [Saprospiraceae bacterium]HMQ85376.1 hypothetical protein [Saprospiraceae bacterium]